ncbi:hypothetical protein BV898_02416 [Hypsibius exemplaris]|uniref:HTH CENPB-type domain-containing protein n=1 Tax=Hypsibius exemplaris TaxID=2072580 RepID=A0A1W0X8E8_HYPEX|nr:hypothetical protein BV898_02416 [Hypsibius exemplaris]
MSSALDEAIEAVIVGGVSVHQAAENFEVGRTTLHRHLEKRDIGPLGRQTKFMAEEELVICDLLLRCMEIGVPLSKFHLKKVVHGLCEDKALHHQTFSNGWHRAFLKRHPALSERISQTDSRKKSRQWTEELCLQYITVITGLKEEGYLENPSSLWNLEESGFALGAGYMLRPLILYDGVVMTALRADGTDGNFSLATNKSGWMDDDTLTAFARGIDSVYANRQECHIHRWAFSYLFNLGFLDVCMQSNREIKVVVFPAGQTGKLQPLDVCVFGWVKYKWRCHLEQLHLNTEGYDQLTQNTFPAHLNIFWSKLNLRDSLQSGFRKTGLFPFDPKVIQETVHIVAKAVPPQEEPTTNSLFEEDQILRTSLKRLGLPESNIESTMQYISQQVCGTSSGFDIAESIHRRLNGSIPPKKTKSG